MPAPVDFRGLAFEVRHVTASGKDVGGKVYWRLYAVENLLRVIVNSVLTAQIGANWWLTAVDPRFQKRVEQVRADYSASPGWTSPGRHELYYTFLPNLSEIMRANSNLFVPVIPDIDGWIARMEQIRLPRNVVGHMNWPSTTDRERIDSLYVDIRALMRRLISSGMQLLIP